MNVSGWADEQLQRWGDFPALHFQGRLWSCAELHQRVCCLAQALIESGLSPGEEVPLSGANTAEQVQLFTAVLRAPADDPTAPCYRGPDQKTLFDLTCIHPTPAGHGVITDLFTSGDRTLYPATKAAMEMLGWRAGEPRAPLHRLEGEPLAGLERGLVELGLLSKKAA